MSVIVITLTLLYGRSRAEIHEQFEAHTHARRRNRESSGRSWNHNMKPDDMGEQHRMEGLQPPGDPPDEWK